MSDEGEFVEMHEIEPMVVKEALVDPEGQPIHFPEETAPDGNPLGPAPSKSGETLEDEVDGKTGLVEKIQPTRMRRFATILSLLNSLLGAGILGVPGSLKHIGIIPSILLIAVIALLSHIGTVMTVRLRERLDADGFDDLAMRVLGKVGSIALSICIMLFCISCDVAYLVIGSDSLLSFLRLAGLEITSTWARALLVLIFWALVPGLLTIPRNVSFLKYCAYLNFGCIIFFIISMIIKACINIPRDGVADIVIADFGMGIFSAISIYGLAFALPVVVLPIIEPYNTDLHKRSIVSGAATILCFFIVSIPGILGYLILGTKAKDNVLLAFPDDDILILCVRVAFLAVVSCSFPAVTQSLMSSWSAVIYKINTPRDLTGWRRASIIAIGNAIPLLISMFLPNAGPALSIGGAFGGCLADFFFPPIMWFKLSKNPWYSWRNLLCLLFALFGIVSCAISTYLAIVDAIDAFS